MKKVILFFILFITSVEVIAKQKNNNNSGLDSVATSTETKPFFKDKDLGKPKNVIIDNDFDITYILLTGIDSCKISIDIKNISKEERRNSFSVEAYTYANKKYETFIVEKRSKPGEIVNTQVTLKGTGIECDDIKKIIFYK